MMVVLVATFRFDNSRFEDGHHDVANIIVAEGDVSIDDVLG